MKSFFRQVALTALCFTASIYAIIQPEPGSFAISGEYLYFHPLYNQSYFVIENDTHPLNNGINGKRVDNPLNYESGFRVEGIYAFCNGCSDLDLRFTYLNSDHNVRSVTSPFLTSGVNGQSSVFVYSGKASSTIDLKYYAVDALYGQKLYSYCCFDLKLQGGLHYANLQFSQDLLFRGVRSSEPFDVTHNARAKFWGIGPELALAMEYELPTCFTGGCFGLSLVGNARGALLAGQSDTSYYSKFLVNNVFPSIRNYDFNNDDKWLLVPMWDLRLGLGIDRSFSCFSVDLEVGFEILRYEEVIQTQNPIVYDAVITDDYSELGFYGPYVALGFSF